MCGIDNRRYYAPANCLEEETLLPLLAGCGISLDGRCTRNSGYPSAPIYSPCRPNPVGRVGGKLALNAGGFGCSSQATGHWHISRYPPSLDRLVYPQQELACDRQPDGFRGSEVHYKFEFRRLFDRDIGGSCALQNGVNLAGSIPIQRGKDWPIRHQASIQNVISEFIYSGQFGLLGPLDDPAPMYPKENLRCNKERIDPRADLGQFEIDLIRHRHRNRDNVDPKSTCSSLCLLPGGLPQRIGRIPER